MKSMVGGSLAWTIVMGMLAVGCPDSKHSTNGEGSPPTGNAGVDELIGAACDAYENCCLATGVSIERGECVRQYSGIEEFQDVRAGKVVFNEPERTQCVQAIHELGQSCTEASFLPCLQMYDGTLPIGAICERAIECQRGSELIACVHPYVNDDIFPGTCEAVSVGQLGSPCVLTIGEGEDKAPLTYYEEDPNAPLIACLRHDGLYCDIGTHTCKSIVMPGQACTGTWDDCPDGYQCSTTCVPLRKLGETCDDYTWCDDGLSCSDQGTCAVRKITDGDRCEEGDFT